MTTLLDRAWKQREEQIYPQLFGDLGEGIYTLSEQLFEEIFRQPFEPQWLFVGVFACPPAEGSRTWRYVSSGLSNPWDLQEPPDEPGTPSWLGTEFFLETTEPGDWAIRLMQQVIGFQILLAHDRFPQWDPLGHWDRIPIGESLDGAESVLRWAVVTPPAPFPEYFDLESGRVGLLRLVGASENEVRVLREHGDESFAELLADSQADRITNPSRQCTAPGLL